MNPTASRVTGLLQARSRPAAKCTKKRTAHCWTIPDERAADLKYVGSTSDAPQLRAAHQNPLKVGLTYFALSTYGKFRHAISPQVYVVYIDGNGDGKADAELDTMRLPASTSDTGVWLTALFDYTKSGDNTDLEPINAALGNTDTAGFDSNVLVLPVATGALPHVSAKHSRIKYVVEAYSGLSQAPLDTIGHVDSKRRLTGALSMDVLHPGLTVTGRYTGRHLTLGRSQAGDPATR